MQMQNQLKKNNRKIKKSHTLLFGSLLIFGGFIFLSWNYLLKMREAVYSDMRIAMMDIPAPAENLQAEVVEDDTPAPAPSEPPQEENYTIDYSKYLGVLEIPKIWLKRGFYNVGNRYNDIEYNVTMVDGSNLPDVPNGNLILMAHSGTSYISFFAYLYRLVVGDECYVTYNGNIYHYRIVNIYNVPKNGVVGIERNYNKTTLTMITCTKDNDSMQTVYIAELI